MPCSQEAALRDEKGEVVRLTSLFSEIGPELWARGASVGIPMDCGAVACALRYVGRCLVVLPSRQDLLSLASDARVLGLGDVFTLQEPPLDASALRSGEAFLARGGVISDWSVSPNGILMATPGALAAPFSFGGVGPTLKVGASVGRDALTKWLSENGYRRSELVWQPGEFAFRGGIVDLFDPSERAPLRVEFFDEDVASLRFFQPRSQRSFASPESFTVRSARPERETMPDWGEFRLIYLQPGKLDAAFAAFCELYNEIVPEKKRLAAEAFAQFQLSAGGRPRLRVSAPGDGLHQVDMSLRTVPFFRGDLRAARAFVSSRLAEGYTVTVTSRNLEGSSFPEGVRFVRGASLSGGVVDTERHEAWISDAELFGVSEVSGPEIDCGMPVDLESSLKAGQWVVHEKYGVCQLEGTSVEDFSGGACETIVLRFAGSDRLIIPASELFRLTPWNGDGEPEPDSLSSRRWRTAWKKAEAQIEAEAQGLLTLYAKRELEPGRAFAHDGELLGKFEDAFPYKETPDQLKAIRDVKRDMERPWPMDRLIVGDVGYGKTEVALRAAVKAVENGTQAAIIAPTTTLALQHYRTCLARIGDLPLRVGLLSRMVPRKTQREVLAEVADGSVDILIGTHRLFQNDLAFHDLGLLIVDEEHRFGVKHKERLKALHPGLHVLSLSATPIPRSLSMALRGIRDISIIATPPRGRGETFTVTSRWDSALAYDAILRELARGGQVYYLHNRIDDIEEVAGRLSNRFPDCRVAVAHGQMPERQLEECMDEFYAGHIGILVCTTIIESGLDVPRANTLIVDDVRRLGLAQMHQIRGRIGRRGENAYALFFYEADELPGQTRERLEALGAVSSQNGGYQLAQRDLEIRGAGEILGTEQHGFKERIGYTLYLRKLRERVDQLRGKDAPVETELSVPLTIPVGYVPAMDLRVGLYRRLLASLNFREYADMREELLDRYGPIPDGVQGLLDVALIRGEGPCAGLKRIKVSQLYLTLEGEFIPGAFPPPRWVAQGKGRVGLGGTRGLSLVANELCRVGGQIPADVLRPGR